MVEIRIRNDSIFRTHQDVPILLLGRRLEIPAAQSALNVGHGMADNHLNVAVASDGTLYAAVKTSYDTTGKTKIGLLVRRPSGTWDPLYTVDTQRNQADRAIGRRYRSLDGVYTTATGGGDTVYRETSLDNISFSPRVTLIKGYDDNVTSTKQNVTNQIVVIVGNGQDSATKAV